jgi:hypothetical protein
VLGEPIEEIAALEAAADAGGGFLTGPGADDDEDVTDGELGDVASGDDSPEPAGAGSPAPTSG